MPAYREIIGRFIKSECDVCLLVPMRYEDLKEFFSNFINYCIETRIYCHFKFNSGKLWVEYNNYKLFFRNRYEKSIGFKKYINTQGEDITKELRKYE